MKKRKILYISGGNMDYGLMRATLLAISKNPNLSLKILITGDQKETVKDIKKRGILFSHIKEIHGKGNKESRVLFISNFLSRLVKEIKKTKPDIILLLGDRAEMLAGAIAGVYLNIAVAHVHGGDKSQTEDEIIRHAITKLSHIHFPTSSVSEKRIEKMGEKKDNIFIVGHPGFDEIVHPIETDLNILKKYKLEESKPFLIVRYNPDDSLNLQNNGKRTKKILDSIKELSIAAIVVYPNKDPGWRAVRNMIDKYKEKYPIFRVYENISRSDYIELMRRAVALVGNSSGGVIETAPLRLPVISIGERQKGREKLGNNIIEVVDYNVEEIKGAILKARDDKKFQNKLKLYKVSENEGHAGEKIANLLAEIKIDKFLFQKQITY